MSHLPRNRKTTAGDEVARIEETLLDTHQITFVSGVVYDVHGRRVPLHVPLSGRCLVVTTSGHRFEAVDLGRTLGALRFAELPSRVLVHYPPKEIAAVWYFTSPRDRRERRDPLDRWRRPFVGGGS